MPTHHIVTKIETLLTQNDMFLENLFLSSNVKQIRKELVRLQEKGHIYIGAEGCRYFDSFVGCRCAENEKKL